MKIILGWVMVVLTGFGPLAYASARLDCAGRMVRLPASAASDTSERAGFVAGPKKMTADHACCPKRACQCSIKAPSGHSTLPTQTDLERTGQSPLTLPAETANLGQWPRSAPRLIFSSSSPPSFRSAFSTVLRV